MGLSTDKANVSIQAKARILAVWNTVLNFISGENFFRPMLDTNRDDYVKVVKETLKFILVPAFTSEEKRTVSQADPSPVQRFRVQGSEVKD